MRNHCYLKPSWYYASKMKKNAFEKCQRYVNETEAKQNDHQNVLGCLDHLITKLN